MTITDVIKKEIRARFMLKRQSPYLIYLRLPKFSKSPMNAILAQCEYFTVREITVADTASIDLDTTSFRSLIVTEGSAKLEINHETLSLEKGNSIFVPAQSGRLNIYGNCTLIMSQV